MSPSPFAPRRSWRFIKPWSVQYRRLFSSTLRPKKPGPKGPRKALIQAIVELKSRKRKTPH
jgi:hypothetical protein